MHRLWICGFFAACLGCSEQADDAEDCDLQPDAALEFTQVSLVKDFSSSLCPVIDAEVLNESLVDAGASSCETAIDGCTLSVECDVSGASGGGRLNYANGEFSGILEVTEPIECAYSVSAATL